jgi:hypothetical protein
LLRRRQAGRQAVSDGAASEPIRPAPGGGLQSVPECMRKAAKPAGTGRSTVDGGGVACFGLRRQRGLPAPAEKRGIVRARRGVDRLLLGQFSRGGGSGSPDLPS